jgi:hypothetical protein
MGLLSKAISIQVVTGRDRGLLRRLTMYSRELTPPAANAASPPSPAAEPSAGTATGSRPPAAAPSAGGLLKKSLLFLNLEKEEVPGSESLLIVDFSDNIERLRQRIGRLAKDFSFFPGLYSLLVKDLALPHSAFFLYSPLRGEFVPWMHRGIEARFVPALAFSEKNWAEHDRRPRSERSLSGCLLEDENRLFPALPGRLPKPLFLFPFLDGGTLEGSLLVSNFPVHPDSRPSLGALFRTLSAEIGPAIAALMRGLEALPRPERFYRTPAEALAACLARQNSEADSFHVVVVPLAPFFQTLKAAYGFFDVPRLREIMLYAVNCWLADLGAGLAFGGEDIILVTRGRAYYSPRLLARFISDRLKEFFRGLFDAAPALIPSRAIEFPGSGDLQPDALLARLSP